MRPIPKRVHDWPTIWWSLLALALIVLAFYIDGQLS